MIDPDEWQITDTQQAAVEDLFEETEYTDRVQRRRRQNIEQVDLDLSVERYWKAIVVGVVTTRLRSGTGSNVAEFLDKDPLPLGLDRWPENGDLSFAQDTLADHGIPSIQRGEYLAENHAWFQSGGADYLMDIGDRLHASSSIPEKAQIFREIQAALAIQPYLTGIGPKQSRNYWQWLGLFQWETPLDSRVLEWIETMPETPERVELQQSDLGDESSYRTVMSWIQALCRETEVLPCLLDAAIFESQESTE